MCSLAAAGPRLFQGVRYEVPKRSAAVVPYLKRNARKWHQQDILHMRATNTTKTILLQMVFVCLRSPDS